MAWECLCGVSNRDSKTECAACGTPKGMVWTPQGFVPPEEVTAFSQDLVTVPFEFTGKVGEYFKIWIVNVSLTILTLGIYSAWAKVRKKRYFYGNTLLQNAPFEYLADPIKILKGRLIVVGVFVVYTLTTNFLPATESLFGLLFFGIFPWVVVRALTFKTRNSSYRNIRFGFTASYGEAAGVFILKAIFVGVTFGLAYPFFAHSRSKFAMDHSSYGKTRFVFGAPVNSFYFIYFLAGLVGLGGVVALQVFLPLFSFFLPPTPAQQAPGLAPAMRVRSCNHTSFLFDLCRLSVSPVSDRMWTSSGGVGGGAGSGSRTRTGAKAQQILSVPLGYVNSITSWTWVCRTRQNLAFRDPKTQPIRNRLPQSLLFSLLHSLEVPFSVSQLSFRRTTQIFLSEEAGTIHCRRCFFDSAAD